MKFELKKSINNKRQGYYIPILIIVVLLAVGIFAFKLITIAENIVSLVQENKQLRNALANLTDEDVIGYAKVIEDKGDVKKIKFVECARGNRFVPLVEKTVELEGNEIFFDLLVISFDKNLIMSGEKKALYIWRRIYSNKMTPENGIEVNAFGSEPLRYADISTQAGLNNTAKAVFWKDLWNLANDPNRLAGKGIKAIDGKVVYNDLRKGVIYKFMLSADGNPTVEEDPSLD